MPCLWISRRNPEDDRGRKDHCSCFVKVKLGTFPQMDQYAFQCRQSIRWQFKNEERRVTFKEGLTHQRSHRKSSQHTNHIDGKKSRRPPYRWKECGDDQRVDRQLCAATHQWHNKKGGHSVTPRLNHTRSHDGGNAASKTNQERNKTLSL